MAEFRVVGFEIRCEELMRGGNLERGKPILLFLKPCREVTLWMLGNDLEYSSEEHKPTRGGSVKPGPG